MSHAYPEVISARLTTQQLTKVLRAASRAGLSPSAYTRKLMVRLADGASGYSDPAEAISAVCEALSLPPDSDATVIQAALSALLSALDDGDSTPPPPPPDGANENADPIPPAAGTAGLSRNELKAIARAGMTPAEFLAARAALKTKPNAPAARAPRGVDLSTREGRELSAKLKAAGLTPDEFETLKAGAVKRI